jgi:hypothetical protein
MQRRRWRLPGQARFNRLLPFSPKLGAVGSEHLDAVVMGGVVAGGDHQPPGGPHPSDCAGHRRGGTEPQIPHVTAGGRQARRQSRHQHRAAAAGVGPDQDRPLRRQDNTAPIAQLKGKGRGDVASHPPADAVGAEAGDAVPQGEADRRWGGTGNLLHHADTRTPRQGTWCIAQRQRRGHHSQRSSSTTAASCTTPTIQPGSQRKGGKGRRSVTTPAATAKARARRR